MVEGREGKEEKIGKETRKIRDTILLTIPYFLFFLLLTHSLTTYSSTNSLFHSSRLLIPYSIYPLLRSLSSSPASLISLLTNLLIIYSSTSYLLIKLTHPFHQLTTHSLLVFPLCITYPLIHSFIIYTSTDSPLTHSAYYPFPHLSTPSLPVFLHCITNFLTHSLTPSPTNSLFTHPGYSSHHSSIPFIRFPTMHH